MTRIDRVPLPQSIQSRALREELKDGRGKGTILG